MGSHTLSSEPKLLCLFYLGGHMQPLGTFMIRVRENHWHMLTSCVSVVVLLSGKAQTDLKEFIALIVTRPEKLLKDIS